MRIGHAAFALVAKRVRPRVPVVLLLVAAYGPDLVQGFFDLLGRHSLELSHSLVSSGVLAAVSSAAYWLWRRDAADAAAIGLTYLSHWPADLITGIMKPTWPGGPVVGFGLYDHPLADWSLEIALVVAAALWSRRSWSRPP